jgi:hypothetical protein
MEHETTGSQVQKCYYLAIQATSLDGFYSLQLYAVYCNAFLIRRCLAFHTFIPISGIHLCRFTLIYLYFFCTFSLMFQFLILLLPILSPCIVFSCQFLLYCHLLPILPDCGPPTLPLASLLCLYSPQSFRISSPTGSTKPRLCSTYS